MNTKVAFPWQVAGNGRTRAADIEAYIAQIVELLLFTSPGERVMRPQLGTEIRQLLFAPLNDELTAAVEFTVRGALVQNLQREIEVRDLTVARQDSTLRITIRYALTDDTFERVLELEREVS